VKVLFVAMADSIHTARWIGQLSGQPWSLALFSSTSNARTHEDLSGLTVHHLCRPRGRPGIRLRGVPLVSQRLAARSARTLDRQWPGLRPRRLAALVRRFRPDVVHSLEIQHAGYLTLAAKKLLGGDFPPWLVTNWGSDIYLFRRFPEHEHQIRETLASCDAYTCECARDVGQAADMGFTGRVFGPAPCAGGYDLPRAAALRQGRPSARRLVMLKGYHGWAGRALVALEALGRLPDLLKGYRLCVYSAVPEVATAARALAARTGLPVEILTRRRPHEEQLRRHGAARLSIGLSISDGASVSFLEALLMGSFPIQSWTSCAGEWIRDGKTGILVPPEDVEAVAAAIRTALEDDDLVDRAADENWRTAERRLDAGPLREAAASMYMALAGGRTA
jgi:hypothetical protein